MHAKASLTVLGVFTLLCALTVLSPAAVAQDGAAAWDGDAIARLQADMKSGAITSRELVRVYLARIDAIDKHGPALNSVIEVNPDALAIAQALDEERARSGPRGPLHGIPVLLKDNIDTGDKMLTTAGSLALVNSHAAQDAFLVKKLREAGAVILGKTNLSEWANFRSTHSTSGWSARGGLTRNPYALERNTCGSSSGSGAAIAANLAVIAVGTETDGSIVCPSGINGIVGIKPTVGLVSRSGVIPISASQDTAGPMALSVADAAAMLTALAGADPKDSATTVASRPAAVDYTSFLKRDGLRGARIGVARSLGGFDARVDGLLDQAIVAMRAQGAEIVELPDFKIDEKLGDLELTVLKYEFKTGLNAYLATRSDAPKTMAELIAFNNQQAARELQHFGQEILIDSEAKGSLDSREYRDAAAKAKRLAGRDGIDAALKKHKLDALIGPTVGLAWLTDLVNGDHYTGGNSAQAAAVAGYPHITVPAGFVAGLPVGVSFIGTAWSEPKLIQYAYAYEQATRARRPPKL
jgi:amidase